MSTVADRKRTLTEIDFEQLSRLHEMFLEPHGGKDVGLNRLKFREALQKTVGWSMTDAETDETFTIMDSQCLGILKWSDYISCLAQHQLERSYMAQAAIKPLFSSTINFLRSRETIVAIRFIPRLELISTAIDYTRGRYIMLGRDGTVSFWSIAIRPLSYHFIGSSIVKDSMYFIDLVVMYPTNMISVTSTQRSITMYEFGSKGFVQRYHIAAVADCVTCMDYWADLRSRTKMLLVWGDTAGSIHALEFNLNRPGGIFGKDEARVIITRVLYSDLIRGKYSTVRIHKVSSVHYSWVTHVKYLPEYDGFLSSSTCQRTPLIMADWYGKRDHRKYNTIRSVLCFDYSHMLNKVVTGELDCCVRVWNFFMKVRPVAILRNHTRPVIMVVINVSTLHIISADKGHAINVFSLMDFTYIQHFSGPSMIGHLGRMVISGTFYNHVKNQLIVGTANVAVASREGSDQDRAEVPSHEQPIVSACYSGATDQIISACRGAFISVWDIYTGRLILQFRHFSSRNDMKELPYEPYARRLELTAMALDPTERLAVSGANDGTVNLWNFSTGVLLMQYATPEDSLISDIIADKLSYTLNAAHQPEIHFQHYIYATGWHRTIYFFDMDFVDNPNNAAVVRQFWRRHKEDILCMCLVHPNLFASASYDGDIFVVARDTGHGVCRMNACVSRFPIQQKVKTGRQEEEENAMDKLSQ
nr:hypothetical protein BaRGS_015073 [Batillaria attramentaria]